MSTAPLNRDEQIELMKDASARMDSFVQKWSKSAVVAELLCEPHSELTDDDDYYRSGERIARHG